VGRHDFADGHAEGVFFFGVEERVAVEVNHTVCDAAVAEALGDEFCYADNDLGGVLASIF
jgi:hypothetical protein